METREESPDIVQSILKIISEQQLGKYKLASFLKGPMSRKADMLACKEGYGLLFQYSPSTIEGFIEQLEEMKLIEKKMKQGYPYPYPVYVLTEAGKNAMRTTSKGTLKEIKKHRPISIDASEIETLTLFKQGKTISEIAKERNFAESTIYTHMYRLIVCGYVRSSQIISEEKQKVIERVCTQFKARPPLKEIKALLPAEITYDEIRCVVAGVFRGQNAD